MYLVCL